MCDLRRDPLMKVGHWVLSASYHLEEFVWEETLNKAKFIHSFIQKADAPQRPRENVPHARPESPRLQLQHPPTRAPSVGEPFGPGSASPVTSGPTVAVRQSEMKSWSFFHSEGRTSSSSSSSSSSSFIHLFNKATLLIKLFSGVLWGF